jgi:hypothetical protein
MLHHYIEVHFHRKCLGQSQAIGVHKIKIPDDFYNFIIENAMIMVGFWKMDGFLIQKLNIIQIL